MEKNIGELQELRDRIPDREELLIETKRILDVLRQRKTSPVEWDLMVWMGEILDPEPDRKEDLDETEEIRDAPAQVEKSTSGFIMLMWTRGNWDLAGMSPGSC